MSRRHHKLASDVKYKRVDLTVVPEEAFSHMSPGFRRKLVRVGPAMGERPGFNRIRAKSLSKLKALERRISRRHRRDEARKEVAEVY